MRDFKRGGDDRGGSRFGDRGSRKPSFGGSFGRKSFGDRGDKPEMHKAVCSECKQPCEVPFRPTGDKPVYCRDCFGSKGGASQDRFGGRKDFGRRDEPRFAPRNDRGSNGGNEAMKKQLDEMNSKLDTIVRLLEEKQ